MLVSQAPSISSVCEDLFHPKMSFQASSIFTIVYGGV